MLFRSKKYRTSINSANPQLKKDFYRIFALKWETPEERNMFESHKKLSLGTKNQPIHARPLSAHKANLNSMLAHLGKNKNYVVVAGAGVAAQLVDGTNPESSCARSWPGLLSLLRPRIESFVGTLITEYFESWYPAALDNEDNLMERAHMLHSMIKVYNLHNCADVDYTRFISALLKGIRPKHPTPELAETLKNLNVLIGTTNYDMLLEETMDRFEFNLPDCFNDEYNPDIINAEVRKLFPTNYSLHIYHLHGVWHSRAELTLGVEYGNGNENFHSAMDALTREFADATILREFDTAGLLVDGQALDSICKPVVFIGTGQGVFDYHFSNWLDRCNQRHYTLVTESEFDNVSASIAGVGLTGKLIPVVYGKYFDDLNEFIKNNLPQRPHF